MLAIILSGCAGMSASTQVSSSEDIRGTIPECFHFTIQDESAREYLASADLQLMPSDRKLEVVILRELTGVSDENELSIIFDRIWKRHKKVKGIIGSRESREQNLYPLAEIYYLLSVPHSPDWQNKMAEKLYSETLRHVAPQQLSGYALHFYTLALLKNGKANAAIPYLERMGDLTEKNIYVKDLGIALGYATESREYDAASCLMAMVCENAMDGNATFPEGKMESALQAFKKAGRMDVARQALLPIVTRYPHLKEFSFAQFLKEPQKTASQELISSATSPNDAVVSNENRKENRVRVEIQIIKASRQSNYIDPALGEVGDDLKKTLSFTSFTLVSDETLSLKPGERGEFRLPNGSVGHVVPHKISSDKSRIEVRILQEGKEIFNTFVESGDGGVTIIGGPQVDSGMLLLRLTVFIVTTDVAQVDRLGSTV